MDRYDVVIVGASLAGVRSAAALRREGFEGSIALISDETHTPYDRPPLSKQILQGKWGAEKISLVTEELWDTLAADWMLSDPAIALDVQSHVVSLDSGEQVQGDTIIIATGVRARTLPFSGRHLLTVRTLDDSLALASYLDTMSPGTPIAVIGAGFIGAEVATALKMRDMRPVIFEAQARPLESVLGSTVATWLEGLPAAFGVELRCSVSISDIVDREGGVVVHAGDSFEAIGAILGVGSVPNVEWLESSGLTIDNGVVVNEHLEAAPGIYAAGDVSRFPYTSAGETSLTRIEHWQVANDHAAYIASRIAKGVDDPFATIPYFWSDQYGSKIQMLGHPKPTDQVTMALGSVEEGKWVAHYRRKGEVTGVISLNNPRELMLSRSLLEMS